MQTGGTAGSQIAADVGGAEEHDLRLVGLDSVGHHLGVGVGGVVLQQRRFTQVDLVGAVAAQVLGQVLHVVTHQQAAQVYAQLIGQLAALGDQLVAGGHHHALALLAEYPYIFKGGNIRTVISSHDSGAPFD